MRARQRVRRAPHPPPSAARRTRRQAPPAPRLTRRHPRTRAPPLPAAEEGALRLHGLSLEPARPEPRGAGGRRQLSFHTYAVQPPLGLGEGPAANGGPVSGAGGSVTEEAARELASWIDETPSH